MILVAFEYLMSLKGKCSDGPFLLGSLKRNKSDYSRELGKRFTKQPIKLHKRLGNHMKTKDFPYGNQSS